MSLTTRIQLLGGFKMMLSNQVRRRSVTNQRWLSTSIAPSGGSAAANSMNALIDHPGEPKHYIPRAERSADRPMFKMEKHYDNRLSRKHRTEPTRELNFTHEHWTRHKSVFRRFRHIGQVFRSSPIQRLAFPDLFFVGSLASGLCYYNVYLAAELGTGIISIDSGAFTVASTAVGLLAGFRLNASYDRYFEGRQIWGEINNASRDLAGEAMMFLSKEQAARMCNLVKTFPVALNFHLNSKGGHYHMSRSDQNFEQQRCAEFYAELKDIYKDEQDPEFTRMYSAFEQGRHVPLVVTTAMREVIADAVVEGNTDPFFLAQIDSQVIRLVGGLGQCERVLRTPIPTCFTRHTSRLFFVWSNLLPFALYSAVGPLGTIPASLMISYAVLGIEDIGVQLEEPFNILPLRQYSDGMSDGVDTIKGNYTMMYGSATVANVERMQQNGYRGPGTRPRPVNASKEMMMLLQKKEGMRNYHQEASELTDNDEETELTAAGR